ncbi:transporter, major facilitator family protein [Parvimonas sp. KA00067]|uniref:MFS transporter n=1 Tax=Parvimonas sp. KA00067 TaxID=1588755 RepID=UPI000798BECF|nr:MFS transporter [Parvimonas sp. KA00067]KXB66520.1 transporter, major facilitator family protein [Parvimonas sp. KA00067]
MKNFKDKLFCLKGYYFFSSLVFYAPVALLIRTSRGVSISEFFILQAILSFGIFIFEIPFGIITDKIGYKNSIIISHFSMLLARIILLFSFSFEFFVLESILEAVGFAFASGTIIGYEYEIIGEENFAVESSILGNYSTVGFIVSTISFYFMNKYFGQNFLIIFTIISTFISFLFTLFLEKEKGFEKDDTKLNFKSILNKYLIIFMVFNGMISITFILINFFYVVILQNINLSENYMTFVILLYSVIGLLSPKIIKMFGEVKLKRNLFIFLTMSSVLLMSLILIKNIFVILPMIFLPMLIGIVETYFSKVENRYVDSLNDKNRATILSTFSMGANVVDFGFLFVSSKLAENSLNYSFIFVSILLLIFGLFFAVTKFIEE